MFLLKNAKMFYFERESLEWFYLKINSTPVQPQSEKKIRKISFRDLTKVIPSEKNNNKRILSKMKNLNYTHLDMQNYFKSSFVNKKYDRQIFKYRTRMAKVSNNYKNSSVPCATNIKIHRHIY